MHNKQFITLLRFAAISGNILFALWVTFNGLKEHFSGTIYEKLSYIGLVGLLSINSFLILSKSTTKTSAQ
ncbi:MAG: hypothetical protein JST50_09245 [Bacteroidetes bacterium]|jgi:hypothetical protein|nr:hypothetical protein [Bacteroidota bacterium]